MSPGTGLNDLLASWAAEDASMSELYEQVSLLDSSELKDLLGTNSGKRTHESDSSSKDDWLEHAYEPVTIPAYPERCRTNRKHGL